MFRRFNGFRTYFEQWLRGGGWPSEKHWQAKGIDTPLPSSAANLLDFLLMPAVRAVLDLPGSDPLENSDFQEALHPDLLSECVFRWYRERKAEVTNFLRDTLGPDSPVHRLEDPLALAAYTFDCARKDEFTCCHEQFMAFPDVLSHRCGRHWTPSSKFPKMSYEAIVHAYGPSESLKPAWTTSGLAVNKRVIPDLAYSVIRACDMDPETSTHEDMWTCKKRLSCRQCLEAVKIRELIEEVHLPRQVFNWKGAVGIDTMQFTKLTRTHALMLLYVDPSSRL